MTKKRVVDFLLALTGGAITLVGYFYIEDWYYWVVALGGGLLMLLFLILMVRDGRAGPEPPVRPADGMAHPPAGSLTEIVLLNEEDQALSSWTLYGKTGMVIGRDSGENQVNINLANSTYAGTGAQAPAYISACHPSVRSLHSWSSSPPRTSFRQNNSAPRAPRPPCQHRSSWRD